MGAVFCVCVCVKCKKAARSIELKGKFPESAVVCGVGTVMVEN